MLRIQEIKEKLSKIYRLASFMFLQRKHVKVINIYQIIKPLFKIHKQNDTQALIDNNNNDSYKYIETNNDKQTKDDRKRLMEIEKVLSDQNASKFKKWMANKAKQKILNRIQK